MPSPSLLTDKRKIVYLFGAGATHAELSNLYPDEDLDKKRGLLIGHVSSRVIERARRDPRYLKNVEMVSGTAGSLNIELLVSLLENSKIHNWADKTARLKTLVERDIRAVLKTSLTRRFFLHKALLELHQLQIVRDKEELLALISVNYDDVLDQAYKELVSRQVNYCFSLRTDLPSSSNLPLLKLHGSFNWKNRQIFSNKRTVEIIPVGSSKSYLHAPYGFIWNRTLDSLVRCDVLRVIGCSLSPNDVHLIDLLFKAHLERSQAFDIEIIDRDAAGQQIKDNYGFLPGIKRIGQLTVPAIADPDPHNAFLVWLKYLGSELVKAVDLKALKGTRYLKKVVT